MTVALFYRNPRPLELARDADLKVREITDLSFARDVNCIPINLVEFGAVARHYPICFVGDDATPMAIVGLQKENLFLDEQGRWKPGVYVPAFIRRYPFILADNGKDNKFSLSIDDTPEAVSTEEGRALFENGKISALTKQALEFCTAYQQSANGTQLFSRAIKEAALLVEQQADARMTAGETYTLKGFKGVDANKLRKVPARVLGKWNDQNWLAPLYAHLQSMTNWNDLIELMPRAEAKALEPAEAVA
jgi:hypothetical protein